jgi:hypothetical protein
MNQIKKFKSKYPKTFYFIIIIIVIWALSSFFIPIIVPIIILGIVFIGYIHLYVKIVGFEESKKE